MALITRFLYLLLIVLMSSSVWAKKRNAQTGVVRGNGTPVYKDRSFDAPVIGYLDAGKKYKITIKKYKGYADFGLFYKIKIKDGLVGFIADTDIIPQYTEKVGAKKPKENPVFNQVQKKPEKRKKPQAPIYDSQYIGVTFAQVNFTESVSGRDLSSTTSLFGFKLSGPGAVSETMPLDAEILFSPSAPSYYNTFADSEPAGFFLIGNLALMFPIKEKPESFLFFSLGLTANYTNFKLFINSQSYTSKELKLGILGNLGYSYRFKRDYLAKIEAKYFIEKKMYPGLGFALQSNF